MIFDYGHDDINHMMDWGLNGWIYMILGAILFVVIAIILLYVLSRRTRPEKLTNISQQEATLDKETEEKLMSEKSYFCPNCGEKLDERILKYCPYCGSQI